MQEKVNEIWAAIEADDLDKVYDLIKTNGEADEVFVDPVGTAGRVWTNFSRGDLFADPVGTAQRVWGGGAKASWDQPDGPYEYTNFRPLMAASFHGNKDIVNILIEHGADVNEKSSNGLTALHIAVEARQVEVVHALLSNGADASAPMTCGTTPLHLTIPDGEVADDASMRDHMFECMQCEIACLLVLKKANQNTRDDAGQCPLDRAFTMKNHVMIELLSWLYLCSRDDLMHAIQNLRFKWTGYLIELSKNGICE